MRRAAEDRSGLGLARFDSRTPVGAVIAFAGDLTVAQVERRIIVEGWVPCDGRQLPVHRFHELYAVIGRLYTASGIDKKQFCVPDYRGQFFRTVATTTGQDPGLNERTPPPGGQSGGTVGSTQVQMVQTHQHHYQALEDVVAGESGSGAGVPSPTPSTTTDLLDPSGAALNGEETRPKNIYVHHLIKALPVTRGIGVVW
jgi:microcystin-dependent protein